MLVEPDHNLPTPGFRDACPGGIRAALWSRGGVQLKSLPKGLKAAKAVMPESKTNLESGAGPSIWSDLELLQVYFKSLAIPSLTSEVEKSHPVEASKATQPSLKNVLRARGGVQIEASQRPPVMTKGVEVQPSVTEKVTEFFGTLTPALGPSHASSVATAFSSLTNGFSTLFESPTMPQKEKMGGGSEPLASVLRRRGGALAEDGYESFFEYRGEPQVQGTSETCKKGCKEEESMPPKVQGSQNSLAAALRRRGGSVDEEDGFEIFYEYTKEGTPHQGRPDQEDLHIKTDQAGSTSDEQSIWACQIRRNLKKPQSFHLPENDIEADSPQNSPQKASSDLSRFAQLQSLWESRTPYAGASLNETTRISKTEAQAALQRLSMKGFFGPGDLDEVRKLKQALLDADE